MPDFTLKDYIALHTIVAFHDGADLDGEAAKIVNDARDALHALRKFFPSFDLWEREQAARLTP
ncbi:MAG: hypothetical protein KF826_15745 [Xanthobacteraceae bacterium]|nr:hypothetical protein [Xanthobacteraceae bacterium]MCW5678415.1 hypothetical protein [Xanthobacteraceae bacterium]